MALNYWETHLYTFAVAVSQGDNIKPENLAGMRRKAINNGHSEADCQFVVDNNKLYISKGTLYLEGYKPKPTTPAQVRHGKLCASCGSLNVVCDGIVKLLSIV